MSVLDQRRVARAFGAIRRAARTDVGISQEVLAARADIDRTSAISSAVSKRTTKCARGVRAYSLRRRC
jgi:ribosome-binding protein aMBF1 (putative translation factor)